MTAPALDAACVAELMSRLYRGRRRRWTPPTRCDCGTGKIRYRNETQALAAAEAGSWDLGVPFRVYKCPGSSSWHKTTSGFRPEALRSRPRIMAWHLSARGAMTQDALIAGLGIEQFTDDRGQRRKYGNAITTIRVFAALGLVILDDPRPGYVSVASREGLRRVMMTGLEEYVRSAGISWME